MNQILTTLTVSLVASLSASAATISFSNYNTNTNGDLIPIVTSADALIDGAGVAALGYFTDDLAVASGDFSGFVEFGNVNFSTPAAFSTDSVFNDSLSGDILSGSSFIGKAMYAYITFGGEALVSKSNSLTFGEDAPLFTAEFIASQDVAYLFGGNITTVDVGFGSQSAVQTSLVPEPSTFAALAGLCSLGVVMVRRRRA